jgi:hypothetical protein
MYKRGDKGGQEDVSNTTAVEAMCIRDLYVECSMFLQQHDTMHDCPGDGTVPYEFARDIDFFNFTTALTSRVARLAAETRQASERDESEQHDCASRE